MKRRKFITLLGGAAAAWPIAASAQQSERMRRIGVLVNLPADDPQAQVRNAALLQGLQELGWTVGRNLRIDYWGAGNADNVRKFAAELVALAPDVILAPGTSTLEPLLQATRAVPIVFVHTADPVGAGFVQSLARPGGNATGFINMEYAISGKWLELLKQIAPRVTRAAVLRDPTLTSSTDVRIASENGEESPATIQGPLAKPGSRTANAVIVTVEDVPTGTGPKSTRPEDRVRDSA
jgi:putative tryptophan/tyrosine transport system substrate-binding protein